MLSLMAFPLFVSDYKPYVVTEVASSTSFWAQKPNAGTLRLFALRIFGFAERGGGFITGRETY